MAIEVRWIPSAAASALYMACELEAEADDRRTPGSAAGAGTPGIDADLARALEPACTQMKAALEEVGVPWSDLEQHGLPLAAGQLSQREWTEVFLRKACGSGYLEAHAKAVQDSWRELNRVVQQQYPNLGEELRLRLGLWREQWEARGPGLIAQLERQLGDENLVPDRAEVILVQPFRGGGGKAHLLYNAVHVEAVAANPWPRLPEVLRLAWLVSQVNMELPQYQGKLPRRELTTLVELALVPAVMSAAEGLEMAAADRASVAEALSAWRVLPTGAGPRAAEQVAGVLVDWWETFLGSRPGWEVGLVALEQMLVKAAQ